MSTLKHCLTNHTFVLQIKWKPYDMWYIKRFMVPVYNALHQVN